MRDVDAEPVAGSGAMRAGVAEERPPRAVADPGMAATSTRRSSKGDARNSWDTCMTKLL